MDSKILTFCQCSLVTPTAIFVEYSKPLVLPIWMQYATECGIPFAYNPYAKGCTDMEVHSLYRSPAFPGRESSNLYPIQHFLHLLNNFWQFLDRASLHSLTGNRFDSVIAEFPDFISSMLSLVVSSRYCFTKEICLTSLCHRIWQH